MRSTTIAAATRISSPRLLRYAPALQAACLLSSTLLVFWPSYQAGFIWDDDAMITENPLVKGGCDGLRAIWFSTRFHDYVPLTLTSFWLEWRLWGAQKCGYHAVNVLLHALNVLLLWRVLRRLRIPGGWLIALLFALHPVCVTSVTWVAERKNTLSMAFFLLSLLGYWRAEHDPLAPGSQPARAGPEAPESDGRQSEPKSAMPVAAAPQPVYYWLSLLAFFLGLCSKPSIVVLPVVLLLCRWWGCRGLARRDLARLAPFFLLAAAFGLKTIAMNHFHGPARTVELSADSLLVRSLGASWAVWFYLGKDLLPLNLTMHYPRWPVDPTAPLCYLPALALLGCLLLFWRYRGGWGRACLFGIGYFLVALAPALGVLNMAYLTFSRVADHLQYLALPGLIALLVGSVCQLTQPTTSPAASVAHPQHPAPEPRPRHRALTLSRLLAAGLVMWLAALTWQREWIVGQPEALWRDNIRKHPNSWPARNNLGRILADRRDYAAAEQECRAAVALEPGSAAAHYNLGLALYYQQKLDPAIGEFSAAVRLAPADSSSHNNLANALFQQGRIEAAIAHYREALRLDPANAEARSSFANALTQQGRAEEAKTLYLEALRRKPEDATAHNNLGQLLAVEGKLDEALPHFAAAVRLEPGSPEAQANLANVLALRGDLEQSARHYLVAVRLQPESAVLRMRLGDVLTRQGRTDAAAEQYALAHALDAANLSRQGQTSAAIAEWRLALRFKPDSAETLNNLAWLLATSTDPQCRNGAEAVQLAQQARALAGSPSPSFLDTLAAAYAEAGRFDEAQKTAQQAVAAAEQAGAREQAARLRARLKLYQSGQPYREIK